MHPIVFRVGVIVKNAPSTLKGCIVSIYSTQASVRWYANNYLYILASSNSQAILGVQIGTIFEWMLSFLRLPQTP